MTIRFHVLVAVSCCAALAACGHEAPEEVETQTVVPVTTEAAALGTIRTQIHATGSVEPAPGADLLVRPPDAARIAEMPKAEGDVVHRGDVLVRFEIPSLNADVAAKRAEITRAEARIKNAQAAQVRAHDLFDRGVAARKEVEDADREISDAQAALAEARAAAGAAETLAERTVVRATFDGVVAQRTHNPGDFVDVSATDPVLRVIDPHRLEVRAAIPIPDVSRVTPGAAATLTAATDTTEALKVLTRPAAVVPGAASAAARLAFVAQTKLAAGTPVQLDIDAEEHKNVLVVPVSAIVREGNETAVFVADGGKAHRRAIEVGAEDASHVEVKSGLKAGDLVIVRGQTGLPDGASITVGTAEK